MITFHTDEEKNRLHEAEAVLAYPGWTPPSPKELEARRANYEHIWGEVGDQLMKRMELLTGLQFEPHIECFVLSGTLRDYSNPLLLKSRYDRNEFIVALCHELTHRLTAGFDFKDYDGLPISVQNHIVTYAILSLILTPEQMEIAEDVRDEPYVEALEIVTRDGAEKILESFRLQGK